MCSLFTASLCFFQQRKKKKNEFVKKKKKERKNPWEEIYVEIFKIPQIKQR